MKILVFSNEETKLITAGLVLEIKHLNDQIKSDKKNGKEKLNRVNWRQQKIEKCQKLLLKFGGTYFTPKTVVKKIMNQSVLGNPPYSI